MRETFLFRCDENKTHFFPHPTPCYWYPVTSALEALQGHYTSSPEVSFATRERRALSQGVGPPTFSFKSKFIFVNLSVSKIVAQFIVDAFDERPVKL